MDQPEFATFWAADAKRQEDAINASAACKDDRPAAAATRCRIGTRIMTLRADHVAGAFFVGFGMLVIALSGDLPIGSLSIPGSGFLPKILAVLTILFGVVLVAARARRASPSPSWTWSDAQACRPGGRDHRGRHRAFTTGLAFSPRWCCDLRAAGRHRAAQFAARRGLQPRRRRCHLRLVRIRAQDAAQHRPVRLLGSRVETTLLSLAHGFAVAFQPDNLWYAFLGCLVGTLVGVLPGIGPLSGISILLPVTFGLNATQAIIMLAGIYYGSQYGGSTTSILMRIPGRSLLGDDLHRRLRHGARKAAPAPRSASPRSAPGSAAPSASSCSPWWRRRWRRIALQLRPAGIHRAAGARPDLPRLHVVVVADPHAADGLPRPAARHDRHRQHDRPFPLQLRSRRARRRHRHRAGRGRPVRARRNPVDAEQRAPSANVISPKLRDLLPTASEWHEAAMPIARGTLLGFIIGIIPGLGAHHFQLSVLCAGEARLQASGGIRQGRGRRRRRPGNRQQRRLDRRLRADAGARHSDQPDHRGADRRLDAARHLGRADAGQRAARTCSGASSPRCMSAT